MSWSDIAVIKRKAKKSPGMPAAFCFETLRENLRGADFTEEVGDLMAEMLALGFQRFGGALHILGGGRCVGVGFHARDVFRDVLGALRRVLRGAGDLLGRGALFLHGGGNRSRDLVDLADDRADALDRVDGLARDLLDVGDLLGYLIGR